MLVRVELKRGRYGRGGAAILSVGIGVTGLVTYAYFSLASHSLSEREYGSITLLWSAVFIIVSVLYRPVEQLLSRTIADRDARGVDRQRAPARGGHDPARAGRAVRRGRAGAPRPDRGRALRRLAAALLDPDRRGARLRGELLRARLPGRQPPLRALRRAGVHGGDLALHVRAGGGGRDRRGPDGGRAAASRPRRWCRWRWCRGRSAAGCGASPSRHATRSTRPPADEPSAEGDARVHARPRRRLRGRGAR